MRAAENSDRQQPFDVADESTRNRERIDFQRRAILHTRMFSPFVLADRAAFVLLCLYFLFWPVWYASEEKLSVRLGELRIEHLTVLLIILLGSVAVIWTRSSIPGFWQLCLLIIYGALALGWSVNPKAGALVLLNLFSVLLFAEILSRNRRRQWSALLFFLAGLLLMLGVSVFRAEVPGATDFRLVFPEGIDPNQLAVQGAMAVVILTYVAVAEFKTGGKSAFRFWGAVLLGLPAVGVIVLTGSRTGIVAVITGASIVLFVRRDSSRRLRIWHSRLALIPAVAILGTLVVVPLMQSRSASLLERYEEGFFRGDLAGRDTVWKAGARYFASSPRLMFLGGGLGSFDESVVDYLSKPFRDVALEMSTLDSSRPYPNFAAHNDFVRLGCDLGIVGLGLFLAFYVEVGCACHRAAVAVHGTVLQMALLVTLIVSSMALDLVTFPVYAVVLALVIAPCLQHSPKASG